MAKNQFMKIQCQTCKEVNYYTHKSKAFAEVKLELNKFCKCCKKHTPHKEAKR